jgi:hypothetical protein
MCGNLIGMTVQRFHHQFLSLLQFCVRGDEQVEGVVQERRLYLEHNEGRFSEGLVCYL